MIEIYQNQPVVWDENDKKFGISYMEDKVSEECMNAVEEELENQNLEITEENDASEVIDKVFTSTQGPQQVAEDIWYGLPDDPFQIQTFLEQL
jgi:hypothetical protein